MKLMLFTLALWGLFPTLLESQILSTHSHQVIEWGYQSGKSYQDPFRDVEVRAEITQPDGSVVNLPAFWAGGNEWRFRYASGMSGIHEFETICSDSSNFGLHGKKGRIEIRKYKGENPLFQHGPIRVSNDDRYLEHEDGTPFFWLADSWWHGMTTRFSWPGDFKELTQDRKDKGFSVIQFAIGFPCDIEPFDPRGQNQAGDPWTSDFGTINPAYFDLVDLRFNWLLKQGLVPNIVGLWGYYMKFMGVEKVKEHWDYLIARYGAYPVTWTLCGEVTLAYYPDLESDWEYYKEQFREQWSEVARHIQQHDPFDRLLTVHPGPGIHDGKDPLNDMDALDFVMVQSGHGGFHSLPKAREFVDRFMTRCPDQPVMHGEVCFEGMNGGGSGEKVQRFLFWTDLMSGTCGFSYGVEGIWQFNTKSQLFGASPGGNIWGNVPWEVACHYPGSKQLGVGKAILEKFDWWKLKPDPGRVTQNGDDELFRPYAATIGDSQIIFYLPQFPTRWRNMTVHGLSVDKQYSGEFIDPITGEKHLIADFGPDEAGNWSIPSAPIMQDWVMVLKEL